MKYRKTTDVQATWKEFGWTPPSEDPVIQSKWHHYQTIHVEGEDGRGRSIQGTGGKIESQEHFPFRMETNL